MAAPKVNQNGMYRFGKHFSAALPHAGRFAKSRDRQDLQQVGDGGLETPKKPPEKRDVLDAGVVKTGVTPPPPYLPAFDPRFLKLAKDWEKLSDEQRRLVQAILGA